MEGRTVDFSTISAKFYVKLYKNHFFLLTLNYILNEPILLTDNIRRRADKITWRLCSQICYDSMYVKNDGKLKPIEWIGLTPDAVVLPLKLKPKQELKRCTSAPPIRPFIITCAPSLTQMSIFWVTLFAETRILISRWHLISSTLRINTRSS